MIQFTGERIVPEADNCEPRFAEKMYQEHIARYAFASQWIQGKHILDVGCGVGYGAHWMAQNGAAKVRAFDISPDAVTHAKQFYSHENVSFEVASATDFNFGERFDVVTCFELIEHVDAQSEVINRIRAALKEDGVLIISTPRALEQKRTHFHTKEFSEQEFRALLSGSFSQIKFYFENNHFSSLIASDIPRRIEHVLPLNNQFSLSQADYFIAVASESQLSLMGDIILPVLVIGDDKYVTLLEHDVAVLHKAEDRLVKELAECNLIVAAMETDKYLISENLAKHANEGASLKNDRSLLTESLAQHLLALTEEQTRTLALDASLQQHMREIEALNDYQQHRELELNGLRDEVTELRTSIASNAEAVKNSMELQRALERQRSDNDYLQELVSATQASVSWKITAPYRIIGGKLLQLLRIFHKTKDYQQKNGTRALMSAIRRRIGTGRGGLAGMETMPIALQADQEPSIANRHFDVVFAIGCWEGESKRYRVYNLAEGLVEMGYRIHVMPYSDISRLSKENVKADVVVLFRAPFDQEVGIEEFLKYSKIRGIKIVFDIDDLVFDPEIIDQIDGFKLLSEKSKMQYIDGVHQYRNLLMKADLVTVPTEYLRARIEKLGKLASVIPNSINREQQIIAAEIIGQPVIPRDFVRIGYFSGSRTHQADFAQCADALFNVMQLNPKTVLRIVGYLDLDARWDSLKGRIERMDFQPYKTMLRVLSECDINIAPLEIDNVFCHGKSELKFFEAGLLGIPTVASATDAFSRTIDSGLNGFISNSKTEWNDVLCELINSGELRKSIGSKAYETAMAYFSIQKVSQVARDVYGLSSTETADAGIESYMPYDQLPLPGRLRISWVIPALIIGGGGHRNILRAAYFLSKFGHRISLYFTGTEQDPQTIKRQIQEHFYPIDCAVYLFEGKICPSDIVFATHWSTVNAALTARGAAQEIMYFVQDFEPAFAPMGTEYVMAENTYRLGLYHITSGPWCEVMLRRDFQADADHFQFPVDRSIYYPRIRNKPNKNLVFFAKPEMPRRCFELGVMALREFHRMRPDVEIVMFGSKHAGKQSYDFPVTIRDVLPTLDDLAQMYSDGDVGLVFSTTNPSLIPYEMIACGLPVVDLARGDNAVNYGGRSDIALLADPQPKRMAEQIAEVVGNPVELSDRREKGLVFVNSFPSEEGMAKRIEELIFARLESKCKI